MSMEVQKTENGWEGIATGYDDFVTPTHMTLAEEALEKAGLDSGQRFLDVAAGSGGLSIPAARLGADVLAVDISASMLARLEERARHEGFRHVETRVMDGHALALEDDTFDLAGSQFGVMLFPDLPRAVAEMTRVVRPGGKVMLNVYGPPDQVGFLKLFLGAMRRVVPGFQGLPSDPPPLEFQVADPERLRQRLQEAGLRDVRVETVQETLRFRSGKDMWDWVVNSNPIVERIIGGLDDAQRQAVVETLDDMIAERRGRDGEALVANPVHIGIGTK